MRDRGKYSLCSRDAGCETDKVLVRYPEFRPAGIGPEGRILYRVRDRYLWLQADAAVPGETGGS